MTSCNHKNLVEHPFIVYVDFESSLIPTGESENINMNKANSAFVMLYAPLTVQEINYMVL